MATVLVVDDEPANRLLVATLLRYAGHHVVEAESGESGLLCAREHRPDLVILDLSMPGMHGTQFVKTLRSDRELAHAKIALYTGTKVDALLADFIAVHRIEHVIPKPCEPEELIRIVTVALCAG